MASIKNKLKFPKNFLWGCATSAHQIEGGLLNDWSEWEQSADRLQQLKNKLLDPHDFISGHAANSYPNNDADIKCLIELAVNSYRFSIDWSRIEPESGRFDQDALDYYVTMVKKLRTHHIEPFITLWHWPLPLWVRDQGGWNNAKTINYFDRFVQKVAEQLQTEVTFWITLNEPEVYSSMSYLTGTWPPQQKNPINYLRVLRTLVDAHRTVYDTLKKINPLNQIGLAKHNIYFEACQNKPINVLLKRAADWWWNEKILNNIKDKQDFIGLNYYFHNRINYGFGKNPNGGKKSDLGWGLYPEGIYYLLKDLKKYNCPIYITENGLADSADRYRAWYIKETVIAMQRAIEEGVPLKGYFHWSLLDNFEWADGFAPRFGLYEVAYENFKRRARPSASLYQQLCKNNGSL